MSLMFVVKGVDINGCSHRILLQNENGPCALIALCNVLLLSPQCARYASPLTQLVTNKSEVALRELITILANIGVQIPQGAQMDVDRLLQSLPQLHTGLSINPIFNGSFEDGDEMALFRLFNVSIVHGWIADYADDPAQYEHVSKYSYEGAQKVLIEAYDIQHGSGSPASPNPGHSAEQVLEDAGYIKSFLARSATQLTEYGLHQLRELLIENSFAVLFRNDHFSTIVKHKNELYALVTDQGYKDDENIVWESLKSVNGSQDTFYTGRFIPATMQKTNTQVTSLTSGSRANNPFSDPFTSSAHERSDNSNGLSDEQYARQLQEEEDARVARNIQRQYEASQSRRRPNGRVTGSEEANPKKSSGSKRKRDKLKKKCIIM